MVTAFVNRISTVVPEHDVHQAFVDFADGTFSQRRKQLLFRRMADRCQISHRWAGIASPESFYGDDPNKVDTATRMVEFERNAPDLAVRAVEGLELGDRAAEITHLIVVTCTGFYSPGIDFELIKRCGISSSVERTQIGFMGCFAGINGLKLAHHIVRSEPGAACSSSASNCARFTCSGPSRSKRCCRSSYSVMDPPRCWYPRTRKASLWTRSTPSWFRTPPS